MGNCFLFTMVFISFGCHNSDHYYFCHLYALPTNVVDSHIKNRYDIMSVFKIIVDFLNHLYFKFVIAKTRFLSFVATNYMSKT